MLGSSRVAAQLAASQEGLSSMSDDACLYVVQQQLIALGSVTTRTS
jgi:hypothetical protein